MIRKCQLARRSCEGAASPAGLTAPCGLVCFAAAIHRRCCRCSRRLRQPPPPPPPSQLGGRASELRASLLPSPPAAASLWEAAWEEGGCGGHGRGEQEQGMQRLRLLPLPRTQRRPRRRAAARSWIWLSGPAAQPSACTLRWRAAAGGELRPLGRSPRCLSPTEPPPRVLPPALLRGRAARAGLSSWPQQSRRAARRKLPVPREHQQRRQQHQQHQQRPPQPQQSQQPQQAQRP